MEIGSARPDDLRRQNRRTILQAVRSAGALSRTDIGAVAGLSHASVSAITTSLLEAGILVEAKSEGNPKRQRGRPQVLLEANASAGLVGALALTIKGLAIALVDYSGRTVREKSTELDILGMSSSEILCCVEADLSQLIERHAAPGSQLRHITLGVQGNTNVELGRVVWSPILRERDVDLRGALTAAFGVPVVIDNDCNLITEALRLSPQFPYEMNFAALQLGHGIGMGLYLGGARFHGSRSSAGEFGHMLFKPHGKKCRCGAMGCIEAYASDYAIVGAVRPELRDQALRGNLPAGAFADLADAARKGDPSAIEAFRTAGKAIGSGLASLFSITDPLPIALVGEGAEALDLMAPAIKEVLLTTAVRNYEGELDFITFSDENQLILKGCSMTSLRYLDTQLFARSKGAESELEKVG